MSKFFIERPVLANVIAFVTMLLGGIALFHLPVAQYPPITPPTIQVTANYPGASAKTLVETVALPIEQQVNGVEKMLYMQSTCTSDGRYSLIVTFKVGTDLDLAQVLVQNRVSAALAQLPEAVQQQGVVTKKKSTAILQIITLTSPDNRYDSLFLSNYASLQLHDRLARLPGVSDVTVFGIGQYSMRVWLDPQEMRQRSLMPSDVITAIQQQNMRVAAGQIAMPPAPGGEDFQLTIDVKGDLTMVEEFAAIIVKFDSGGRITRIRDIGRVELGAQTYSQFFKMDGKAAGGAAIFQLPGANALDTAEHVRAAMVELARDFPQGLEYSIPFDTTKFVTASVNEVYHTLLEAGLLVLIVIVVFLQDWRATLVPATTVPVTIIGAFAAMAALSFSVNLSTLFAIVLAIGIVVDDAIVVVEGAAHQMEKGLSAHDAAIGAMKQLLAPIIGITLVLMAVFVPAAFLPGLTGRIYSQFALVIAATALLSAINAVTLKPTQCALWLRPPVPSGKRNIFYRGFNVVYARCERWYTALISRMVSVSGLMAVVALALIGFGAWGLYRVPTGFLPIEDQGYLLAIAQLPDGASFERTGKVINHVTEIAARTPGVERVVGISGVSALDNNASLANAGVAYIVLKDWAQRSAGQDLRSLVVGLNQAMAGILEARVIVLPPPPIQGIGNAAGFAMQIELRDGSFDFGKLQAITTAMVSAGQSQSSLQRVSSPFRASVPEIDIEVDRLKAETLHVTTDQIFSTLASYLGSSYVDQFNRFGRTFQIYVQADA